MVKGHRQIVTSIIKQEEQFTGFTQLLGVVARSTGQLEVFTGGPSQAQEVWQELQPSLARVGSLEELVARVGGDLSSFKEQVEQAEATFGAGEVIQLVSLVLKSLLFSLHNCSSFHCRIG